MLTRKDKVIIEKGGMLSDIHMNAAQKLLGEQFPHLQSLQSTLLSQTSSFISLFARDAHIYCEDGHPDVYIYVNIVIGVPIFT